MHLTKHHGLGNDFLVAADPSWSPDPAVARALCDRTRGVGADGLLHLGGPVGGADVSMVLLNADGSRAEMSGNGIGCLVQAAVLAGRASGPTVDVATDAGRRVVEIRPGETATTHVVTVSMGKPEVGDDVPAWTDDDILRATPVNVGNPHLVLHAAHVGRLADRRWIADLGRRANAAIPGGVNLEVVARGDRAGEVVMDVFERGVGLTSACGTGAVATAVAARRWDLVDDRVVVNMTGGPAVVDLAGPEATLTTPIAYVASVDVADLADLAGVR
jgi:diaminopimelate epimerase